MTIDKVVFSVGAFNVFNSKSNALVSDVIFSFVDFNQYYSFLEQKINYFSISFQKKRKFLVARFLK